jgi:hypothetical protein
VQKRARVVGQLPLRIRNADVHEVASRHESHRSLPYQGREHFAFTGGTALGKPGHNLAPDQLHASVDEPAAAGRLLCEGRDHAGGIERYATEASGVGHPGERNCERLPVGTMSGDHRRKIDGRELVSIQDQGRPALQVPARSAQRAAPAKGLGLARREQFQSEDPLPGEVRPHRLRTIADREDRAPDSGSRQVPKQILDKGATGDRQHRFGEGARHATHAVPQPPCQNDGGDAG